MNERTKLASDLPNTPPARRRRSRPVRPGVFALLAALSIGASVTAQEGAVAPAAERLQAAKPAPKPPTRTPDVIFVPTPEPVVDRMLQLAKPKKGDLVYDLGCGDGRIVVAAAKRFGTRAVGFDIDPERVAEARENVRKNKMEHLVSIEQRDIFTLDLSPANVVTLYLLPELNVRLIPQLEKLKPGARIVSHDFDMRGVKPIQVVKVQANREHVVYLFRSPLDREGTPAKREQTAPSTLVEQLGW